MNKLSLKIILCIFIIFTLFIFFVPKWTSKYNKVYADNDPVPAGTIIEIPESIEQYYATCESEDVSWNSTSVQYKVNQLWVEQGKLMDSNDWAYVVIAGETRYLVALGQSFGLSGDFVDIYLRDGTVYNCLIGDSKSKTDVKNKYNDGAFFHQGLHLGHNYGGKLNVIEIMLGTPGNSDVSEAASKLMATLTPVAKIENRGNYFDFGTPSQITAQKSSNKKNKAETFFEMVGNNLRETVDSLLTHFDNMMTGQDDVTVGYRVFSVNTNTNTDRAKSASIQGMLKSAEKIAKFMHDNNFYYYDDWRLLRPVYTDISTRQSCCSTYISWILQDCGIISDSEHFDDPEGIDRLCENNPDWQKITITNERDFQEGDINLYYNNRHHCNMVAKTINSGGTDVTMYWDAGEDGAAAFLGIPKTRSFGNDGYSYTYRYKK